MNLQNIFFLLYLTRIEVYMTIDTLLENIDLDNLNLKDLSLLLEILTEHFADNHILYDDIVGNELIEEFKD